MPTFTDDEERKRRAEEDAQERNERYGSSGVWPWDEPDYDQSPNIERRVVFWIIPFIFACIIICMVGIWLILR